MKLLSQQGLGAMVLLTSGIVDERPLSRGRSLSTAHACVGVEPEAEREAEVLAHCWALRDQASRSRPAPLSSLREQRPARVRLDAGGYEP